jgi:thymidylate synthase (FAD)
MDKIDVLDHGFVRLVDSMGGDLSVVRAARVSYDAEWRAGDDTEGDRKLINYLWKNKHSTPFEAVTLTFEVKAPIFVYRQWHRHRTWSYNELSARYRELPEEFYIPEIDQITTQSADNKQMRTDIIHPKSDEMQAHMFSQNTQAFKLYQSMLADGCPRELARAVLPLATYSHMFATVNLLNLMKFLTLRCHEHAQYEIVVYAEALLVLAYNIAPVCMQAFINNSGIDYAKIKQRLFGRNI